MAIAREQGLSRSEALEAIPTNPSGPLVELDQVFQAFCGALTSAMASILGPGHSTSSQAHTLRSENKAIPMQGKYWGKNDDPNRLSRSDLVSLKLAKLKASSSPSRPLCFKCGAPGHIANQCRNETLCFVCNRFGHSSMGCRSMTTKIPVSPQSPHRQYHQAESSPNQQSLPVSYEISVMDSIKRLAIELTTIKHELMLLQKRRDAMEIDMAGINSQFRRIQCNLAEIEQGSKTDYQQPQKESDNDNEIETTNKGNTPICDAMTIGNDPSCNWESDAIHDDKMVTEVEKHQSEVHPKDFPSKTVETSSEGPAGSQNKDCWTVSQVVATQNLKPTSIPTLALSTPAQTQPDSGFVPAQRVDEDVGKDLVPAIPVDQGSWISQITRTKIKQAKSGSKELNRSQITLKAKFDSKEMNRVALSREKRSIKFKRAAAKGRERRDVSWKPMEIAAIQLALLLAVASGNTHYFAVRRD